MTHHTPPPPHTHTHTTHTHTYPSPCHLSPCLRGKCFALSGAFLEPTASWCVCSDACSTGSTLTHTHTQRLTTPSPISPFLPSQALDAAKSTAILTQLKAARIIPDVVDDFKPSAELTCVDCLTA